MSSSTTPRLGFIKPTPGTGEPVNLATQINAMLDKIDASLGASIVTSTTRPVSPWDGQLIRETDTRRLYVRSNPNAAWDQIVSAGSAQLSQIDVERAAVGDHAYRTKVTGESQPRLIVQADGVFSWGSGGGASDTNLYRGGASILKTDDTFDAPSYRVQGSSGRLMTQFNDFQLGAQYTLTTTMTDLSGMSWTFTTVKASALAVVSWRGDFNTTASSAGTGLIRINVDGTDVATPEAHFSGANTTAGARSTSGSETHIILGSAGSHTIKARAQLSGPAGIRLEAAHTTMDIRIFE